MDPASPIVMVMGATTWQKKDGESGSSHPICIDENNLWPFPVEDIDHCVACL